MDHFPGMTFMQVAHARRNLLSVLVLSQPQVTLDATYGRV